MRFLEPLRRTLRDWLTDRPTSLEARVPEGTGFITISGTPSKVIGDAILILTEHGTRLIKRYQAIRQDEWDRLFKELGGKVYYQTPKGKMKEFK